MTTARSHRKPRTPRNAQQRAAKETSPSLKHKEQEDYGRFYSRYFKAISAYIAPRVNHRKQVVEDIAQEAFMRTFRRLGAVKDGSVMGFMYLKKTAHNLIINYYRKKEPLPIDMAEKVSIEIDETIARRFRARALRKALLTLTASERTAFILRYWRHLTIRDIARLMSKTESAVKSLLARGRRKLAFDPSLLAAIQFSY